MRAPMALGGGNRMKGMPAPRVTASQMIRIQAPKIAGMSRRSSRCRPCANGRSADSIATQRQASSQAAASSRKIRRQRRAFEAGDAGISSQAARCAPTNSTAASEIAGMLGHRDQSRDQQQAEDQPLSPDRDSRRSRRVAPATALPAAASRQAPPRSGTARAPAPPARRGSGQLMPASRPWRGRRGGRRCRPP